MTAPSEQEWREAIRASLDANIDRHARRGSQYERLRDAVASFLASDLAPLIVREWQQARQEALREALDIVSKKLRLYGLASGSTALYEVADGLDGLIAAVGGAA